MRKVVTILLMFVSLSLAAQVKYYVEANLNHSLILKSDAATTREVTSDMPNLLKFQTDAYFARYNNRPGGALTVGLNYPILNDFSLDAGISLNNYNFMQMLQSRTSFFYQKPNDTEVIKSGTEPIINLKDATHHLLMIGVPVGLSYYLLEEQLALSVGLMPSFLVFNQGGDRLSSDLNKFAMATQLQLRYRFIPGWWLTGGYSEYSTKLYKPSLKQSFSSMREIKLGVRREF